MSDGETTAGPNHGKGAFRAVVVLMVIAIAAAVAGFSLWAGSRVPDGSAAKVNDSYVAESDVDSYIAQYRLSHQLTDDAALAQALASQGMSVAQFRINAINQLAIQELVNTRASELGVSADESKVDAQIDQMKSSIAFNDDDIWEQTLEQYGMSEEQLRAQYRNSLTQRAVCEQEVAHRDPTSSEALSYAKSTLAGVTTRHFYRIVFTGDDAKSRADACKDELTKLQNDGEFDLSAFERIAVAESDEDGVAQSKGSYHWSIALESGSQLSTALANIEKGDVSAVTAVEDDGASEIFYCDADFTFPAQGKISKLEKSDMPKSLWDDVKAGASESIWNADCSSYVAKLLADAKVTYYPVPDGASYDVDLSSVSASSSDSASSAASTAGAADGSASSSASPTPAE